MNFDVLLPAVLFLTISGSVLLYRRLEKSITLLLEERKISSRDAVLMVVSMGIMVTVIVFIPGQAIRITFVAAYSYLLFVFTYIALKKWYLAFLPPILFIFAYLYCWGPAISNLFVVVFAVIITIYLSSLFSWKTVWIFAVVLTIMDVIQVFGTGFMVQSAEKMFELRLPVLLDLPTFPAGSVIRLGLGDIFLAGLLSVQTSLKRGQKAGIFTAATIGVAMFIFEAALLNTMFATFFPATIVVLAGWLAGLGAERIAYLRSYTTVRTEETKQPDCTG